MSREHRLHPTCIDISRIDEMPGFSWVCGPACPIPHPWGCMCGLCDADGFTDGSHAGSPRESTDEEDA